MNKLFRLVPHAIALSCVLTVAGCAEETIVVTCNGIARNHYHCSSWNDRESNKEASQSWDTSKTFTLEKNWRNPETNKIEWIMKDKMSPLAYTNGKVKDKNDSGAEYFRSAILNVSDNSIYYHQVGEDGFEPNKSHDDGKNQRHTYDSKVTINRLTGEWREEHTSETFWINGNTCVSTFTIVGTCEKAAKKF